MTQGPSKSERMEIRQATGNRVILGPNSEARPCGPKYLVAHACFDCRKSWKLSDEKSGTCPQCGSALHWMGRAFKAPKKSDTEQWKKVAVLWNAGFRFLSHTRWSEDEPYPDRLRDVAAFIDRNLDHRFRVKD